MIILGGFLILSALGLFGMGDYALGIFWAAVGSALIAYGIHRNKQRQAQAQQQTVIVNNYTMPQGPGTVVRHTSSVPRRSVFPVAGVTFKNDDGSSRQEILRTICGGGEEGSTEAWLEWYQYRGEDAYRVVTPEGIVGNIRKSDIQAAVTAIGAEKVRLDVEQFENDDEVLIYRADVVV